MKALKLPTPPIVLTVFLIMISIVTISATNTDKENQKIHSAINVLHSYSQMKEGIPHELIEKYQGIVIIPQMINAGFALGGKRGRGIAMVKLENGKWSDPVFVTLTGGSVGLQLGVQAVDLVLVFKNKGVLAKVNNGDFTIGGDISAAAGPVGRSSTASTDHKLEAEIYSYSRSRGLFGGISINGTNLSINKTADADFYGPKMTSQQIFETSKSSSESIKLLRETLNSM
jgi:SH3 domain-containing YSC84-like protein 1